jgi:MarR family transcriptional regulator, organic hydroperoxide resistance regulator
MQRDEDHAFPPPTVSRPDLLDGGGDDWFRSVIYRLVQAADRFQRCREGFGQEEGLTGNQYLVLMGVAYLGRDGGVSVAGLAAHLGLAAPHVTTEVGRLLRRDLLDKRTNPEDRRGVLVSLTGEGEAAVRRIIDVVRPVNDILFDGISQAELEATLSVSRRLVQNADLAIAQLARLRAQRADGAGEG